MKTSDVLDEIIYLIPKAKTQLTDEWVYIIDSGGQPAFQELLPLFTRAASLNVVTLDISKHLDEKYPHQYQASGKLFCFDTESTYRNKKCFESSVLIGIFNQKPLHLEGVTTESPEHTMYFVFGTHYDEFEKMHAGNVESKLIELNVSLPTSIIKKMSFMTSANQWPIKSPSLFYFHSTHCLLRKEMREIKLVSAFPMLY